MEENEIKSISCNNALAPFLRNQYFYGKLLTVRDFENEQSYFIKKQRLINKHIHGEGVVCGLTVEKVDVNHIKIKSGIALDCCGREIIVPDDEIIDLSGKGDGKYWVTISYSECGKEQVAAAINANSCEESCCFSRIEEGYEIEVFDEKSEECTTYNNEGICDVWSDISKVQVESTEFTVERYTSKFVKENENLIVHLKIKAYKDIENMKIEEVVPKGDTVRNILFPKISLKKGEEKVFTYTIKRNDLVKKSKITGIASMANNIFEIPPSVFEPLPMPIPIDLYKLKANKFVNFWHQECPPSEDKPLILAKIKLNGDLIDIDNAIVDEEEKKFEKKLVYSNPRLNELIRCAAEEVPEQKEFPKIEGINWEHDKEYDPFNDDDKKELCKIFKKCTITFDKDMKKENINHKSLHVILLEYAFVDHPDYGYIEEVLGKSFCPIGFDPQNEDKRTEVSFIITPFDMICDIGNVAYWATDRIIKTKIQSTFKSRNTVGKVEAKNAGMRFLIQLKGDFIQDENGNPLDADHIKGERPTGNGTPGGLFESWFDIKQDDSKIYDVQKEINLKPGSSIEEVARKINLSEETTHLISNAMVNNNVIYSEEGKYYPLPDPTKIMIIYDTKTNYLKAEAEKLSERLKEKGVSVTLKSVAGFTDEDKENHEIILLRGNIVDSGTSTKFSDISSKVKWDKSEGEVEIVHKTDKVGSPVFVIGGKNEGSVKTAVENYVKRYSTPQ